MTAFVANNRWPFLTDLGMLAPQSARACECMEREVQEAWFGSGLCGSKLSYAVVAANTEAASPRSRCTIYDFMYSTAALTSFQEDFLGILSPSSAREVFGHI